MCSDRRKNHGCGQKKPGGTSSAIFGVGTAAKSWEHKRCADQVRSRTDNKDEVLEGKLRSLNFSPSTKKTTECSFELFFSIYRNLIFFFKFKTSTLSNNCFAALFAPKHPSISRQEKMAFSARQGFPWDYPHPPPASLRTDIRTYGRTLTSKSNFLASIGYQICLAVVLRYKFTVYFKVFQ